MHKPGKLQIEEFELNRLNKISFVTIFCDQFFWPKQPEYFLGGQKLFMKPRESLSSVPQSIFIFPFIWAAKPHLIRCDVTAICISGFMRLWWPNKQIVYLAWDVSKRFTGLPEKHTYARLTSVRSHLRVVHMCENWQWKYWPLFPTRDDSASNWRDCNFHSNEEEL